MDDDRAVLDLEIEAVVLRPEAVEDMPVPLEPAEPVAADVIEIVFRDPELLQQLQLLEDIQGGNLRRADLIENNLEHPKNLSRSLTCGKQKTGDRGGGGLKFVSVLENRGGLFVCWGRIRVNLPRNTNPHRREDRTLP